MAVNKRFGVVDAEAVEGAPDPVETHGVGAPEVGPDERLPLPLLLLGEVPAYVGTGLTRGARVIQKHALLGVGQGAQRPATVDVGFDMRLPGVAREHQLGAPCRVIGYVRLDVGHLVKGLQPDNLLRLIQTLLARRREVVDPVEGPDGGVLKGAQHFGAHDHRETLTVGRQRGQPFGCPICAIVLGYRDGDGVLVLEDGGQAENLGVPRVQMGAHIARDGADEEVLHD